MSGIDIAALAGPLDEDAPAGPDLEYDPQLIELSGMIASAEAPPADGTEPPAWRDIDKLAQELLTRTRDLRVAGFALRSALHQDGLAGYRAHLGLLRALITNLWEHVHPQLDPDDDNDPTMRMNILASLDDSMVSLRPLRAAPLVASMALGRISWRDIQIANGEIEVPEDDDQEYPSTSTIDSAFMDVGAEAVQETLTLIGESLADVEAIEAAVTDYVGVGNAVSLDELRKLLSAMRTGVERQLARISGTEMPNDAPHENGVAPDGSDTAAGAAVSAPGQIRNRRDVVTTLDRIIAYYRNNEPASPVPMLMQRAKRLVNMDFMDIIRDMAPDGLSQIEAIRGEATGSDDAADDYSEDYDSE